MSWQGIVALVGLATGLIGAIAGIVGLRQASRSNATADAALAVARQAEKRNDRLATIELEHRNVAWSVVSGLDPGLISFQHDGTTRAVTVRLIAEPEGFPARSHGLSTVGPEERIGLNLTTELGELRRLKATTTLARPDLRMNSVRIPAPLSSTSARRGTRRPARLTHECSASRFAD